METVVVRKTQCVVIADAVNSKYREIVIDKFACSCMHYRIMNISNAIK